MSQYSGIANWITQHADATPNKFAIHYLQGQAQTDLNYEVLEERVRQTCEVLTKSLGLKPGERIAWYGMNNPEMLILLFAAARCELILVPVNWRLALPEISFIMDDCTPSAVFHDKHFAKNIPTILSSHPGCHQINIADSGSSARSQSLSQLRLEVDAVNKADSDGSTDVTAKVSEYSVSGDTPLMIVYTSGTTGYPKGALLSHESFACNARMSHHMHDMTASDHILSFLPMFHVGGFNIQMLPALALGATVTLLEKFDPDQVIESLNNRSITHAVCVPTILETLLAHQDWDAQQLSLKALAIGSTDVPRVLIDTIHRYGIPLLQVYGTTETSPLAIYQRSDNVFDSVGSIGQRGSECQIRLVDDLRHDVKAGENGEIWVKGNNTLSAYWNNDEATQENIVDGWFRSGDVARCDEKGFYWFADRLKHVIISGGENIYAAEVERVIRNLPGLAELAVVGRPDPKWGEVVIVVAVRDAAEITSDDVLSERVLQAFHGKLARFKHPREVVFVEALPRTALGKVQVDAVKALIA